MHSRRWMASAVVLAFCGAASAGPVGAPDKTQWIGPDVIVGDLHQVERQGQAGSVVAYAVGTTSCNIGDAELLWYDDGSNVGNVITPTMLRGGNVTWTIDGTNYHPVIAQNMYRLKDGRLEQIGYSWLKHGFTALQGSICVSQFGPCTASSSGGDRLGIGCSDPYSAWLNGEQSNLGPRYQVNPVTGEYPHPFANMPYSGTVARRLQVNAADVDPAQNPGALYFVEGQYVDVDDAYWGNGNNNASYRRILIPSTSANPTFAAGTGTQRARAAIYAWADHGNGANTPRPSVMINTVDVPADGRFHVASDVIDNGDGTWRYEYAIHNMNSDRASGSFSVPVPAGVTVIGIGFKDVDRHSGEQVIYENTDWRGFREANAVSWYTPQPYAVNPGSNAIRWGTMYNFWFTADAPPADADATVGLFKPSDSYPNSMEVVVHAPAPNCLCETDGDGAQVDVFDLLAYLDQWFAAAASADVDGAPGVDVFDLLFFLDCWFPASAGSCA